MKLSRSTPALAAAGAAVLVALSLSSAAAQQQSKEQAVCIKLMNQAAEGVVHAQAVHLTSCIDKTAKGKLNFPHICLLQSSRKLSKARSKLTTKEVAKCGTVPDFGYSPSFETRDTAEDIGESIIDDLLGSDVLSAITPPDKPVGICQKALHKETAALLRKMLKEFSSCKGKLVLDGTIASASDLRDVCFQAILTDEKGKIAKARAKLDNASLKKCEGIDTTTAFPGDCAARSGDFLDCLNERASCRACRALNVFDNLDRDCDLFDNGVSDQSCGVCTLTDTEESQDCDGTCDPADVLGSADCLCEAADAPGARECNGICESSDEPGSPDCDGACDPGDQIGSSDCICDLSDLAGTLECNDVCDSFDEAGSFDCEGTCEVLDAADGPDCDGLCGASDAAAGPDCDEACDVGEAQGGPDCTCLIGDSLADLDCDGACELFDELGSPDCDGICDVFDDPGSADCACNASDPPGSADCNGVCEEIDDLGSPDCDGICDPADFASGVDCDGVCDASDAAHSLDCDGVCDLGDSGASADCKVNCAASDPPASPNCDGICDACEAAASQDCDGVCDPGDDPNSADCPEVRNIAVILLDYANDGTAPSVVDITDGVFGASNLVGMNRTIAEYFDEASYGKSSIIGDVYGWYVPPVPLGPGQCYPADSVAFDMAQNDATFADYDEFFIYIYAIEDAACGFGSTMGNANSVPVSNSTPQGNVTAYVSRLRVDSDDFGGAGIRPDSTMTKRTAKSVAAHEMSHNHGAQHAISYLCTGSSLSTNINDCELVPYGDIFDLMGWRSHAFHPNTIVKERAGWIDPRTVLEVTETGSYTLNALEEAGCGLKALKIPLPTPVPISTATGTPLPIEYIYVEYRGEVDDASISLQVGGTTTITDTAGAMIRGSNCSGSGICTSLLLDMTPQSFDPLVDRDDAADGYLYLGDSFEVPLNAPLTITTTSVGPSSVTVMVSFE